MLRHADTQRLRRSASQSQFRRRARGRRVKVRFSGGPLHRVRTTVPAEADRSVYIGFGVITDRGPVQARCRDEADVGAHGWILETLRTRYGRSHAAGGGDVRPGLRVLIPRSPAAPRGRLASVGRGPGAGPPGRSGRPPPGRRDRPNSGLPNRPPQS